MDVSDNKNNNKNNINNNSDTCSTDEENPYRNCCAPQEKLRGERWGAMLGVERAHEGLVPGAKKDACALSISR